MADSIYTFDPTAGSNSSLDTIPYGPNQLYHNKIDDLFRAFAAKLAQHVDDLGGVNTVAGTANAITATIASGITAYATGQLFWFKNTVGPNTTAATINVNTIGDKEIRLQGDSALSGGEMLDNGYYGLLYDAAYDGAAGGWVLLNPEVSTSITFATNVQAMQASSTTLSVNPANLANLYSISLGLAIEVADLKGSRLNMAGGIADAYDSETDVDTTASTNEEYSASGDLYSPSATSADTRALLTFSSDDPGYTNHNHRVRFGASELSTSGNAFRLSLIGVSSGTGLSVTGMYAGHKASSGDPYDFDGTQVAVTVAGSATFTVGVGATVVTDWITYALDETKDFVVAFHSNGGDIRRRANVDATNYDWWTKGAATEVATSDVTGYSENGTQDMAMVGRIEVQTGVNNMTLVSNAFTATAVPTVARVVAFIDPQVSMTINTDFTAEASRDGGTTYTAVTLALVSNPVGTVEQYEGSVSISAQPSGSSMKYRLKTLNNKDIDVTGVVFQWG